MYYNFNKLSQGKFKSGLKSILFISTFDLILTYCISSLSFSVISVRRRDQYVMESSSAPGIFRSFVC